MRIAGLLVLLVASFAWAAPDHCPANQKPFECHTLALGYHLGVDAKVDLATAKRLYLEACTNGHPGSCNNVATLALQHPDLAEQVDAPALFKKACDRLDGAACDNARPHITPSSPSGSRSVSRWRRMRTGRHSCAPRAVRGTCFAASTLTRATGSPRYSPASAARATAHPVSRPRR